MEALAIGPPVDEDVAIFLIRGGAD